jgi:hypothetical protein
VLLWVGKAVKSPVEPNLKRKPYRIRKVADRKPKKARKTKAKTTDPTAAVVKKPRSKSKAAEASTEATRT